MAIDIGEGAIDRGVSVTSGKTDVAKGNPANASGTITSVEIWALTSLSGCKVGIFYTTNGNTLKCRSAVTIGNVEAGEKRTFPGLSLAVKTGDYIGIYWSSGTIEADLTGYGGVWSKSGDHCVVDDEDTYTLYAGDADSLYGTGVEEGVIHEKVLTDGIAIGEALVKNPIKVFSEGIALNDVLIKNPIKTLVDGIAFLDTLIVGKKQIFEYYITGDDAASKFDGSDWFAQTFTPSGAHKITSVKLLLWRWGEPGTITVSIKATDVDGHPTGIDLCSGTTDGDTLPDTTPYEWREITLGDGYDLEADTKYAIVVRALDGDTENSGRWRYDKTDPTYEDGCYEESTDHGSSWATDTAKDFMFEEWGYPAYTIWTKVLTDGIAIGEALIKSTSKVLTDGIKIREILLKWRWLTPVRRLVPKRLLQPKREEEAK